MRFAFVPRTAFGVPMLFGLMVIALCATTVPTADAQPQRPLRPPQVNAPAAPTDRVPPVETLRLACAPDVVGGQRGILCHWAEAANPTTRGYRLFRTVDGSARQLIASVGAGGRLGFFDTDVTAPSVLVYGVVSLNAAGRVIGASAPQRIELGAPIGALRFACAAESVDGVRGVLCRWSDGPQPGTRGYLVYRQVGDRPREVIARLGLDARLANFDRDVTRGAVHTYAVAAIDGAGTVLATGGPAQVSWPAGG